MKKILSLILILVSINCFSQTGFPGVQSMANASTRLLVNGGLEAKRGIINGVFTDTTAANSDYIDFYNGAQIWTRSDRNFWLRDSVLNMWVRMAKYTDVPAGSGITVGTTTITSGTDRRIPFNDAGIYNESANLLFNAGSELLVGGVSDVGDYDGQFNKGLWVSNIGNSEKGIILSQGTTETNGMVLGSNNSTTNWGIYALNSMVLEMGTGGANILFKPGFGTVQTISTAAITTASNIRLTHGGRELLKQGADVASVAGAITLGADGNAFEITGTNAITLISNTNWQDGSEVTLFFTSTASLTHGTANSGTDIGFELADDVNYTGSAGSSITLKLSEIGGTQRWREKCRKTAGGGSTNIYNTDDSFTGNRIATLGIRSLSFPFGGGANPNYFRLNGGNGTQENSFFDFHLENTAADRYLTWEFFHDGFSLDHAYDAISNQFTVNNGGFSLDAADASESATHYVSPGEIGLIANRIYFEVTDSATAPGYVWTDKNGDGYGSWQPATGGGTPSLNKGITIEAPSASESIGVWKTPVDITISSLAAVVVGSASPSVTVNISFGTDRTSGTNVFSSGQTVTSTTTGHTFNSSFNDATIPAGSFIWIITTAQSGTVTQVELTINYTED